MIDTKLKNNQNGMVAIVIVTILMIVISLITLGYATTTRREQRQALDYALASQAFYAAESGISMAKKTLALNGGNYTKDSCQHNGDPNLDSYTIDSDNNVAITCMLIMPSDNIKGEIGGQSKVYRIAPSSSMDSINISWQNSSPGNISGCAIASVQANRACNQPVLRIDIVNIRNGLNLNRDSLWAGQFSAFLTPTTGGVSSVAYSSAQAANLGSMLGIKCDNGSLHCRVAITVPASTDQYAVRVMSLYGQSDIQIDATSGGLSVPLIGAQTVIDVTARAQDVLKRVQARVSNASNISVPNFAIGAGSAICKNLRAVDNNGSVSVTDACTY